MLQKKRSNLLILTVVILVGVSTWSVITAEAAVKGWIKAGSEPGSYTIGTEKIDGNSVAYIKSIKPVAGKFGTIMQSFSPDEYQGKRVRFSASVKTVGVENWVGMWFRVDKDRKSVAFDNMQDRAISGDTDWKNYSIVLDVPTECDNISMGLLLSDTGEAYWDHLKLEIVGDDVPVTAGAGALPKHPANLDFNN